MSRESDISATVAMWLEHVRGCTVYAEVPTGGGEIDLVGLGSVNDVKSTRRVIAVELKKVLNADVCQQARRNLRYAHESWCAVISEPRETNPYRARVVQLGLRLMHVRGNTVHILYEPPIGPVHVPTCADKLWARALRKGPSSVGGLTSTESAPARRVFAAVVTAFAADPTVKWRALYESIPNHYASARSMQSSMYRYAEFQRLPGLPPR